jgi:N-methylhydantoinase B
MDPMAGGLGARSDMDGIDTGGELVIPKGRIPDVEMNEFCYPILYLWRREERDSGGPGRFRGGVAGSICFMIYDSPGDRVHLVVSHSGKALPMSSGLSGGYPANTARDVLIRSSSIGELIKKGVLPSDLTEIRGTLEIMAPEAETDIYENEVYYTLWQAGGGYGDPLLRDPHRVLQDLVERKISPETTRNIYGVVVDSGCSVDGQKTAQLRDEIKKRRAGGKSILPIGSSRFEQGDIELPVDDNLALMANGAVLCLHCGTHVSEKGKYFLEHAVKSEMPPGDSGLYSWESAKLFVDQEVVMRQYYCPGCYTALQTEVVPKQDESYLSKLW